MYDSGQRTELSDDAVDELTLVGPDPHLSESIGILDEALFLASIRFAS